MGVTPEQIQYAKDALSVLQGNYAAPLVKYGTSLLPDELAGIVNSVYGAGKQGIGLGTTIGGLAGEAGAGAAIGLPAGLVAGLGTYIYGDAFAGPRQQEHAFYDMAQKVGAALKPYSTTSSIYNLITQKMPGMGTRLTNEQAAKIYAANLQAMEKKIDSTNYTPEQKLFLKANYTKSMTDKFNSTFKEGGYTPSYADLKNAGLHIPELPTTAQWVDKNRQKYLAAFNDLYSNTVGKSQGNKLFYPLDKIIYTLAGPNSEQGKGIIEKYKNVLTSRDPVAYKSWHTIAQNIPEWFPQVDILSEVANNPYSRAEARRGRYTDEYINKATWAQSLLEKDPWTSWEIDSSRGLILPQMPDGTTNTSWSSYNQGPTWSELLQGPKPVQTAPAPTAPTAPIAPIVPNTVLIGPNAGKTIPQPTTYVQPLAQLPPPRVNTYAQPTKTGGMIWR